MNFNAQYLNYTVSIIYDKFNVDINIKYGVGIKQLSESLNQVVFTYSHNCAT